MSRHICVQHCLQTIFHPCVKPTAVCILCAHWADHKILVSGDWPDRKRLVNRDCPSEGCDRRPGTTPHQRPCRDLLKRYSNLLKQYSNDFNSLFSALHLLEAVTKKQNSWNIVFLELEYLKRVYSGWTQDSSLYTFQGLFLPTAILFSVYLPDIKGGPGKTPPWA